MAAMLVAIGVMSIMLTVAMPAWRQMVQREKEEELIFRGQQYARSIGLFQRKYAAAYPPDVDTLVQQKFLRKKYKDPMVPDGEFQVLYQASMGQPMVPGLQPGLGQQQRGEGPSGARREQGTQVGAPRDQLRRGDQAQVPRASPFANRPAGGLSGTVGPRGGVIGVVSKSTEKSIRLYNGRDRYNEWQFVYTPSLFGPGQPRPGMRPGQPRPGGRPGQMPGRPPTFGPGAPGNQPSGVRPPTGGNPR
jgi:type II secretory pathway pseudopilin PulG